MTSNLNPESFLGHLVALLLTTRAELRPDKCDLGWQALIAAQAVLIFAFAVKLRKEGRCRSAPLNWIVNQTLSDRNKGLYNIQCYWGGIKYAQSRNLIECSPVDIHFRSAELREPMSISTLYNGVMKLTGMDKEYLRQTINKIAAWHVDDFSGVAINFWSSRLSELEPMPQKEAAVDTATMGGGT